MGAINDTLSEQEISEMMSFLDPSGTGKVTFMDFMDFMVVVQKI
jgi:Ca2+-binding EF-hand superfamily protein